MYIEELAINENFLSAHHIDQIYSAFVHYCNPEENRLSADRYKFLGKQFYSQQNLNYSLDEAKILEKFSSIDLNRDLTVDFQDFFKFIFLNLKFLTGDLSKGLKPEKLNLPLAEEEIVNFHCIVKEILFPLDYNNPFFLSEKMRVFLNKFNPYFIDFPNKYGELKYLDPRIKLDFFSNNFNKIFSKENVNALNFLLNSEDWNNNFHGVLGLNDIVKSLNLLQNHFEVLFYFTEIFNFLEVLMNNQILDFLINLFFKYNVEANAKFFTRIFKIFRRLYATLIKMDELLQTCKEQDFRLNLGFSLDAFYNLLSKFENFYISKIISNLDFLKNKANNYYYLNQIVLFGLEFSKRSKENLLIFFESFSYLEILYANLNYLVNSDNYAFTITNIDKDGLNANSAGSFENKQSESKNRNNALNPEAQKQGFLDINTLVNGKASDPKYLINSNTINANNKNCENFHFFQIRKILFFCVRLTQIILGFKNDYMQNIDRELELPFTKLRYIAEIAMRFFNNTNDHVIEESFFILKTLLMNEEDVNLQFEFLNTSLNKVIEKPNHIFFYNLILKGSLKNSKKALQINSILNSSYINVIKELIFLEPSEYKNLINNNINNNNPNFQIDFDVLKVLNFNLFKDFVEILYVLQSITFDKMLVKDLIFLNITNFALDVFEVIFTNDSIMKNKLEKSLAETNNSGSSSGKYANENLNSMFLMNNQIFKVILELITLLMQTEKDYTTLNILKRNFIDYICSNLDLFLSKNRFYAEALKNDVNSGNDNFDLLIVQKALSIFIDLIDSDYTQIKLEFFIKFFNFDFLAIIKQAFDYFYGIYRTEFKADSSHFNFAIYKKFYQPIENDKFTSFLHQIFSIIFRLLTIFDEFVFSLYIKKTNPSYNFDTSHIEYFSPESQINKNFLIKFSKYNKFKTQQNNPNNINNINNTSLANKNLHNFNKLNYNNNYNSINDKDLESEFNYLNIEHLMRQRQSQKTGLNEIFLSRFICQNYNFREVCSQCENIYMEFDNKLVEIFSEKNLLKGLSTSSKQKLGSTLSFAPNTSKSLLNQSFINLPSGGSIRNIKLILQTPEERYESKAQILKIDNVLNYSYLRLKNEIKMLYAEEFDIYYFSHLKNLKIQINSTEDLIAAFKEEKEFTNRLKQQQSLGNINSSTNINLGNVSKIDSTAFAQSTNNEFEIRLYLEKSSRELNNKEGNTNVCSYCRIQHKISNEYYKRFRETESSYYLMCRRCREFTFLKFINLLTNINSSMNLEQELFNLFPNEQQQHSKSQQLQQQSFIGNSGNPIQMSNLNVSSDYAVQPLLQTNLSRQQPNFNNFNQSLNRNNLPNANLNSASKNDLNYNINSNFNNPNRSFVTKNEINNNYNQSKVNNNLLTSVGRNINNNNTNLNNTLNLSGSNFPMSNYSSINNNNLLANLNNMNMNSVNPQNLNFSISSPNPNLLNTVSRNNLFIPNNPNNNNMNNLNVNSQNTSNKNLNFNNFNKSKGDYNMLHPRKNRTSQYSCDSIQINEEVFDDSNIDVNVNNTNLNSNPQRIKNFNFNNSNSNSNTNNNINNNLVFSGKVNNSDLIKLNNVSEFNLGNPMIMPNPNDINKRNTNNLNFDDNNNSKINQNPDAAENNLVLSNNNLQK